MRLAKLSAICHYPWYNKDTQELELLSTPLHSDTDNRMDKYYGKITLAIPYKKKKILVKGEIKCHWEDSVHYGMFIIYYFTPKNDYQKTKLLTVMGETP